MLCVNLNGLKFTCSKQSLKSKLYKLGETHILYFLQTLQCPFMAIAKPNFFFVFQSKMYCINPHYLKWILLLQGMATKEDVWKMLNDHKVEHVGKHMTMYRMMDDLNNNTTFEARQHLKIHIIVHEILTTTRAIARDILSY